MTEYGTGITLAELKRASFTLAYRVHTGQSAEDAVALTARTALAPYDLGAARPRRLSDAERTLLGTRVPRGGDGA